MLDLAVAVTIGQRIIEFFAPRVDFGNKATVEMMLKEIDELRVKIKQGHGEEKTNLSDIHAGYKKIFEIHEQQKATLENDEQFKLMLNTLFYKEWLINMEGAENTNEIKRISEIWVSRYKKYLPQKAKELNNQIDAILKSETLKDFFNNLKNTGLDASAVAVIIMVILPALGIGAGLFTSIWIFLMGIPGGQVAGGIALLAALLLMKKVKLGGKHKEILDKYIMSQLSPDLDAISGAKQTPKTT